MKIAKEKTALHEKIFFMGKKKLSHLSTKGEDFCTLNREHLQLETQKLGEGLAELQEVLFAEAKHKILIILQGLDTSGKDGTIKHVFSTTNPQGVRVASFKEPSEVEKSHDFLWRIHRELPRNGEIVIFNRSHYEDFIVPRVHKTLPDKVTEGRLQDIQAFESMLVREGVVLIKFFLHISQQEQALRLKQRLDNEKKHWKFSLSDLTERKYWKEYHKAYEEALQATHTKEIPWYVIPADHKFIRNYLISKILVQRLSELHPKLPSFDPQLIKKLKSEANRLL